MNLKIVLLFCVGSILLVLFLEMTEVRLAVKNFRIGLPDSGSIFRRPQQEGPVYVLLLTYMRSGSSFTGDVLQQIQEAFYVFEPLKMFYGEQDILSTEMITNDDEDNVLGARNVIRNWFMCDIDSMPIKYLSDSFLNFGNKTSKFGNCWNDQAKTLENRTAAILSCRPYLHQLCISSPVRVIKTIRMTLHEVRALMEELPNLYIIHLVRDPRGTLNSQRKMGKCGDRYGGQNGCTNNLCQRLENDVYEEEKMLTDYPGRIMPVLYRDMAYRPIETSKTLFRFLGQEFTPEAKSYILQITSAEKEVKKALSTTRTNSSEHVDSWKTELTPTFIKLIEQRCNYILRRFHLEIIYKG